jgi:hypothetical protein
MIGPSTLATSGIFGAGAGGDATAVAVISDLVEIARDRAAMCPHPSFRRARDRRPQWRAQRTRRDAERRVRTPRRGCFSLRPVRRLSTGSGGCVTALVGLQCHLCKTPFPAEALYVCDRCLGPLEAVYDYSAIRLTREEMPGGRRICGGTASCCRSLAPRAPASIQGSPRSCAAIGWRSGSGLTSSMSKTIR